MEVMDDHAAIGCVRSENCDSRTCRWVPSNYSSIAQAVGPDMIIRALLIALIAAAATTAHAGSVYKWVDQNGKVHYGDRPAHGIDSVRLEVEEPRSTSSDISNDRREKQRRLLEAFEREDQQEKEAQAKQKREKQERKIQCARAKDNLERIRNAGYLYRYNNEGEKVVYSKTERQAATREAEQAVRQLC